MEQIRFICVIVLAFALKVSMDEEILIVPPDVEKLLLSIPENPEQICSKNEEFLFCKRGCSTCEDRFCSTPVCEAGCGCKRNHFRIKPNEDCVPVSECPKPECAENEVFLHCGPVCEYCGAFRCQNIDCSYKCFCKPGYLRNESRNCIPEEECEIPDSCPLFEVMTENAPVNDFCWDESSTETVEEEKCACYPNHKRNRGGFCIQEDMCPPSQCEVTEAYYDCVPQCNTTCSNYGDTDCVEDGEICYSSCFCAEGLVMNNDGFCVTYEECNLDPSKKSSFEILTKVFQVHFSQIFGNLQLNVTSESQVDGESQDPEIEDGEGSGDESENSNSYALESGDEVFDSVINQEVDSASEEELDGFKEDENAKDVTENPDDANDEVVASPENANDEAVAIPEDANDEVVAKPEDANDEVAASPEDANDEVVARPEDANDEVVARPEDANDEVVANSEDADVEKSVENKDVANERDDNNDEIAPNSEDKDDVDAEKETGGDDAANVRDDDEVTVSSADIDDVEAEEETEGDKDSSKLRDDDNDDEFVDVKSIEDNKKVDEVDNEENGNNDDDGNANEEDEENEREEPENE